jgi:hypothetical protein
MKKYMFILAAILIPFANAFCAEDASDGKRMTTAERKEKIKSLVETKPNGDVIIGQNPDADVKLKAKAPRVPGYLLDLMLHIDPNLDFEKFNKFMVNVVGDEGSRTGSGVLKACDDYLATNNMRLKPVKFQPNNIRNKLDNGLPYFLILRATEAYNAINQRCMNRPDSGDMKEWEKVLRKNTSKEKRGTTITWALLRGYNKHTNEYFVQVNGQNLWMLEAELKAFLSGIYEPRI